ncbi:Phosphoenolpyruvate synthase regulatory protein [Candidatus Hepatincola sp. Av]
MLDTLRVFFSSSITSLSVYDILVLVLFVLALILTIVFSIILVAAKVRQLDQDVSSRIDENIELDKTILNYLDNISHNLSKKSETAVMSTLNEKPNFTVNAKKQLEEQIGDIANSENQNNTPIVTTTSNVLPSNPATNLSPSLPIPATEQDIASLQKATPKTMLANNPLPQLQEKDVVKQNTPIVDDNFNNKKLFDELARLEQKILQQQEETRKLQTLDRERLLKQQYLSNVDSTLANTKSTIPNDNTIYNPNAYDKKFDEVTLNVLDKESSKKELANNTQKNYENNNFDDFDDDYIDDLPLATTQERAGREHRERRQNREDRDSNERRNIHSHLRVSEYSNRGARTTRNSNYARDNREESSSYTRENLGNNSPRPTRAHRIDTSRPYDRQAGYENTQGNSRQEQRLSNNRYSATSLAPARASYGNNYRSETSYNANLQQGNYANNSPVNNTKYTSLASNRPTTSAYYGRDNAENSSNNYYRQPSNSYTSASSNRLNRNYASNNMANLSPYAANSNTLNQDPMYPRRYTNQPTPLSSSSLGRSIPPRNSSIDNTYNRVGNTNNLNPNNNLNNRRSSGFGARY